MALATRPRLLLLDEVAAGLTETEVEAMARLIRRLRDELELTVIWIEHAVTTLLRHVERVIVLHQGRKIADGTPRRGGAQRRGGRGLPRRRDGGGAHDGRPPAPSAAARGRAHLRVEGLSAGYGAFLVLRDLTLEAQPGPHRDPRPQRRRQDDAAEGDRRPDPAQRRRAARRRRDRCRREDHRDRAARHRAGRPKAASCSRR